MAKDKNPFGFLPARKRDGQPNTEGYGQIVQPVSNSAIGIVSLLPNNIFAGDAIVIDASGTITPVPTNKCKITGVFQGCQYVQDGEPKFSRFFPGGTSVSDVKLHVITDPAQTYFVQADGLVVGRKDIDGDSINGNVSAGDAFPIVECYINMHRSQFFLSAVSVA